MNLQNILSDFTKGASPNAQPGTQQSNPLNAVGSMIPGGLAGGAAAGGIIALLMGSKSTRKIAKKVAAFGGTAVLGGLAYKAYGNWQQNKSLNQTQAVSSHDIEQAGTLIPQQLNTSVAQNDHNSLNLVIVKAMIAASKADDHFDSQEQKRMFEAIEQIGLSDEDKATVFDLMGRDISINEIVQSVTLDEHKAEVYLAAYLAIEVDDQRERTFLNNLAIGLNLPKGLPAYLEQQADQGVAD